MPIDTPQKRQAAFLDACGMLIPHSAPIDAFDRIVLLGMFPGLVAAEVIIPGVRFQTQSPVSKTRTRSRRPVQTITPIRH